MVDDDYRPKIEDSLPSELRNKINGTVQLGLLVLSEFPGIQVADVDDNHFLGDLSFDHYDSSHPYKLSRSSEASVIDQGYLYLRAYADLTLGHLQEYVQVVYPQPTETAYESLTDRERDTTTQSLFAIEHIIHGQPIAEWDEALKQQFDRMGSAWKDAAGEKIARLARLLEQDAFEELRMDWENRTYQDMVFILGITEDEDRF